METIQENSQEATGEIRRYFTVTRIVTVMERWYHIEATSQDEAVTLLEDGLVEREPDKEDASNEWVEAEEEKSESKEKYA